MTGRDASRGGFFERAHDVARAGRSDAAGSGPLAAAAVLTAGAVITWEVGPGNESVIPAIGRHMLERGHTGLRSVVEMMAATGSYVFAQQVLAGTVIALSSGAFPRTIRAASNLFDDGHREDVRPFRSLPLPRRSFYTFFFGAGFNVSREAVRCGRVGLSALWSVVLRSAALAAAIVMTITGLADAAFDRWPANEAVSFVVYDVIGNPYLLGVASAGLLLFDGFGGALSRRSERHGAAIVAGSRIHTSPRSPSDTWTGRETDTAGPGRVSGVEPIAKQHEAR